VTSPQHPAATRPPRHDIAHVGHVELLTGEPEASLRFFVDVLGLTENGREGNSVYLRTWDDYEHHTVKLTAHGTSGIRRVGLRTSSQAALEACVAATEAAGLGIGWKDGDPGIGPTYLCRDPDGHEIELYWESEWYAPPAGLRPALKNQAQAYPGRGVCVRRLDHVNYLAREVEPNGDFVCDVLGGRVTEQIMMDNGSIAAQWLHFTNKGYDLVYTRDWTGSTGRLHHVAFSPDNREDILRAADICLEAGVFIETGPHKHAIQQTFFLYVYEPGGNRIELCHPGARLVLAPDWRTVTWTEAERAKGQAWGLKTIESFHTHGTPPVRLGPRTGFARRGPRARLAYCVACLISEKTAPWLSATTPIRPYGLSRTGWTTVPPSSVTLATAASASSTAKYADQAAGISCGVPSGYSPRPPTSCPSTMSTAYLKPSPLMSWYS